jgi:hypothetical protein
MGKLQVKMFYSTDLLTVQGGRFANVWLLASDDSAKFIK